MSQVLALILVRFLITSACAGVVMICTNVVFGANVSFLHAFLTVILLRVVGGIVRGSS